MQVIKKRAAHILYLLIGKLSFPPYIINCTTKISAIDPHHTIGFDIQSEFEAMAKKTVLKQLLKYAPLKTEFAVGISSDEKNNVVQFSAEADETPTVAVSDFEVVEDDNEYESNVDSDTGELTDLTGTPFEGMEG